jgi:hypothetical protein
MFNRVAGCRIEPAINVDVIVSFVPADLRPGADPVRLLNEA